MRRTLIAAVSLAIALVLQLVVLNGLHLPGGGVPDLVLVLVATLAATGGPVRGMVTGFFAGLALDFAPPGSAVLGEYALTLCLVGWAAAKLSGLVDRSALRALLALGGLIALAEILVAGISIALDPGQLSLDQARQVLPSAIGYDLLILPFLLYAALVARTWAEAGPLDSDLDAASIFAGSATARRRPAKGRHQQQPQPRLAFTSSRPHDGWVGTGAGGRAAALRHPAGPRGLRPGHGVPGSAAGGGLPAPGIPAAPVHIRFDSKAGGRSRGFGVIGNPVGAGLGRHPAQHPGARSPLGRGGARFRPHGGTPGGTAAGQAGGLLRRPPSRPVSVNFGTRRGDGSVGRLLGTPRPFGTGSGAHGAPAAGAGALDRTGRSALRLKFGRPAALKFRSAAPAPARSRPKAEPKFRSGSLAPARSRSKAEPKFRRSPPATSPALAAGLAASGLSQRDVLAARRRQFGAPRLHLSAHRRGGGLLGGPARGLRKQARPAVPHIRAGSSLTRPAQRPAPSQPKFGYGRRSLLHFLIGHRIGGKWLARRRVGRRGQVSLIGRGTGGAR